MKKRITFSVALILSLILGTGPIASLASGSEGPGLIKSVSTTASRNAGNKRESIRPIKAPVIPRILAKRPISKTASDGDLPGQSITLLPDGRLLKIGGLENDGPVAIARFESARTGSVAPASISLQRGRAWHTATMLPDGQILIVGGVGADGQVVDTAELLRVETNSSEAIGASGLTPRVYHTATLLTDGQVLLAGGLSGSAKALKSAELWDFRTRAATRLSSRLRNARYNHTARLLANGNIFLYGGADDAGKSVNDGEEYIATSHRFRLSYSLFDQRREVAPGIADSLPANGSAEAPLDALIALRFSKPLRPETVDTEAVQLTGPQGAVGIKIVPAEGGMLAFISPTTLLFPGATYTLSVSGPLDEGGDALAFASVAFTTLRLDGPVDLSDGEEWIPDESNFRDDWSSHRKDSPWQSLPSLQAEPGVTALAGQVLRLNGRPLPNVTLSIADRTALTDKTGRFLLTHISAGHQSMVIDGRSADKSGKSYCMFDVGVDIEAGKTNKLSYTSWLPLEDTKHATRLEVPTSKEIIATTPRIPGLEVRIPEGVVLRTQHGHPLTVLSLTPIPLDRTPFPLPDGAKLFFSPQGHGAKVEAADGGESKGVRIIFPNISRLAPGLKVDLMTYTSGRGWFTYGQGQVTDDGKQIVPDPGVEFHRLGCLQMILGNPNLAPSEGPPPGSCAKDGDPVDLFTGLFLHYQTDLALPDTLPIALTRTYRPRDSASRIFGIGTSHSYDMFLVGDYSSYAEVVLPDGARVRFNRTSSGTGYVDGVFEHAATPTEFYKSKLTWNNTLFGWDLKFKDGSLWQFKVYNTQIGPPVLVLIQDRYNNSLSIARDTNRKITKITSPNGRWLEFSYDASNRVSQIKDNIGRTVGYQYDASGRLWKITDPAGGVTEHTYDASHRMLTVKDARGIVHVTNEYNANGRVTKQTMADGGIYQFAYTLNGSGQVTQTEVTNPRGILRRVTFNASGYTLTDTYAVGRPEQQGVTYVWESGTNKVLSKIDPLGRATAYTYESNGNLASITYLAGTADAVTTSFTYESMFNQAATISGPLNHSSSYEYNSKGEVIRETDALGNQYTFAYNAAGQMISVTNPLQHTTQFVYDQGDLIKVIDPLGHSSDQFTDAAGRIISETDSSGRTVRYEYDALDRLTRVTDPLQGVTLYSYDANGNLASVTDARGKITSYTYDNMNRLATRTDPLLRVVSYEYDLTGNITKITDRRGKVTTFTYDGVNRATFAGFGTTTSGGTTTHESTVTFTYEAAGCGCGGTGGRLTQLVDSVSGTISYTYDNFDQVISETTSQGTVSYSYDSMGRKTSMTVAGQPTVNYAYDNNDRLTQITQGSATVSFTYDNSGRETSITLPNGVVTEYGYNAASQLTGLTYKKSGNVLGNLTYEYDAAGQITKVGGTFARTDLPQAVSSTNYNSGNHQTGFGSQTLTYDLNGNLTSDGTNTFTWNARDQLISISGPGLNASFQYDGIGRRISKTVNSSTTSSLYDGLNVVQEAVGGSATANMLAGSVDEVFRRTDSSGSWGPIADGLGNVIALTDAAGAIQASYTYEPFGKTTASGSASSNPSQYTGRENDGTGLYYYRARYYSPALQRFISEDPIGFAGGINFYAYVENDPISYSDPLGLQKRSLPQGAKTKCYGTDDCPTLGEKMANGARLVTRRARQLRKAQRKGKADAIHEKELADATSNLVECRDLWMKKCKPCDPQPPPTPPPVPVIPRPPIPPPVPWWQRVPILPHVVPIFINPCIYDPQYCKKTVA